MSDASTHYIKRVQFLGRTRPILLQNVNGPCPLLAICNALLLQGQLDLHPDWSAVTTDQLIQLTGNYIIESNPPPPDPELRENLQRNISDVIALLPRLRFGLDVNVRFCSITDFEFTQECATFDLVGLRLVHGWLVDPQNRVAADVLGTHNYNSVVERVIAGATAETPPAAAATSPPSATSPPVLASPPAAPGASAGAGTVGSVAPAAADEDPTPTSTPVPPPATEVAVPSPASPATQARHDTRRDARIIKEFLDTTASQLTYYGLQQLHEHVRERECVVFFRNNHFSTMFKLEGALYMLVTDLGFRRQPNIVWERLDEIDGDTVYCTSEFRQPRSDEVSDVPQPSPSALAVAALGDSIVDPDFLVAMSMQEQEQQRAGGATVPPTSPPSLPPAAPHAYGGTVCRPPAPATAPAAATVSDAELAMRLQQAELQGGDVPVATPAARPVAAPPLSAQCSSDDDYALAMHMQEQERRAVESAAATTAARPSFHHRPRARRSSDKKKCVVM